MNLLVTLNAGYLHQLRVLLASILAADPSGCFTFYLCHSSLTEEQLRSAAKGFDPDRLQIVSVPVSRDFLKDAPVTDRYPTEMYYRSFAARLLPDTLDRVLYLDPDIVVLQPLKELFELPMGDALFAAASHVRRSLQRLNQLRLDMEPDGLYINSGVMVMNLAQLRREQDAQAVFSYLEAHQNRLMLPDQDVISGLYGDRILPLDPWRWNMTERLFAAEPRGSERARLDWVRQNSAVIHYCGRNKPWKEHYLGSFDVFYREAEALLPG